MEQNKPAEQNKSAEQSKTAEQNKPAKKKSLKTRKPDPAIMNWTPTAIIPPRPQICSSKFQGKKPFYPKFLKDPKKSDIYLLLSEEYRRMWFAALDNYYIFEVDETIDIPARPYLIRYRQPQKTFQEKIDRFIMKRFQNIPSKTKHYSGDHFTKRRSPTITGNQPQVKTNVQTGNGQCVPPVASSFGPIVTVVPNVDDHSI